MSTKFCKQEYEMVAQIMRDARMVEGNGAKTVCALAVAKFCNVFAADNPKFSIERFLQACDEPGKLL